MKWLHDAVWQQGVAILLVTGGAALVYRSPQHDPTGLLPGFLLFAAGIALPLVSGLWRTHRQKQQQR